MDRDLAKTLASACFIVFVVLGAVPLVQWVVFDHANGVIRRLFHPEGAMVWGTPLVIAVVAFAGACVFGSLAERSDAST